MNASRPVLVVVTGPPAAGKSTLARALAPRLGMPLFAKDDVKEGLYEDVGIGDGSRAWSGRLGRAAFRILYDHARRVLAAGGSVMVEANFDPVLSAPPLRAMAEVAGAGVVQLLLRIDPATVVRRYAERTAGGARHPGHLDAAVLDAWRSTPPPAAAPLPLPGVLIEIDANDVAALDPDRVLDRVRPAVEEAARGA